MGTFEAVRPHMARLSAIGSTSQSRAFSRPTDDDEPDPRIEEFQSLICYLLRKNEQLRMALSVAGSPRAGD
jgi:hypothetical protein